MRKRMSHALDGIGKKNMIHLVKDIHRGGKVLLNIDRNRQSIVYYKNQLMGDISVV